MAQATTNSVLQALPANVFEEVNEACERVDLGGGDILAHVGEPTSTVYFPETAVISTLASYSDGSVIEMANVGREACTGINLVLGSPKQLNVDEVQIGGTALTIPARKFIDLKNTLPEFERTLFATVQAVFYQVMVSGACNGAHGAKQRLARWLLTMRDRSDDKEMRLTQEFLAKILGVRRATVTDSASALQNAGHIDYTRGRIRIVDRAGLEAASCECYHRVSEAYETLLTDRQNGE